MSELGKENHGKLYGVFHAADRQFPVYYVYYDDLGYCIPQFPDFSEAPQYHSSGHPFASAPQDGCSHALPLVSGEPFPGDCGSCRFFHRDEHAAVIGLCICEARRLTKQKMEELT